MMQTENIPTYHERRMIYAIYDAMMQRADLQELLAYVARYDKCSCVMRERVMRSLVFIFEGRSGSAKKCLKQLAEQLR